MWLLKVTAGFRRRSEVGSLQTFMHSSACSCCSFNNASPQLTASRLITFAASSVLGSLNDVGTDWSWEQQGWYSLFPHTAQNVLQQGRQGGPWWGEGRRQAGMHSPHGMPTWRTGLGADTGAGTSLQNHKGRLIKLKAEHKTNLVPGTWMSLLALTMLFIHLKASTHTFQLRTLEGLAGSYSDFLDRAWNQKSRSNSSKDFGTSI